MLGFDGCHLRGSFGGILLSAVATDPNDGMYPVAWAHVEAENNQSWDWFLALLKDDLGIINDGAFTFISDKQKVSLLVCLFCIQFYNCFMHLITEPLYLCC